MYNNKILFLKINWIKKKHYSKKNNLHILKILMIFKKDYLINSLIILKPSKKSPMQIMCKEKDSILKLIVLKISKIDLKIKNLT
jgi:hypothetical protein